MTKSDVLKQFPTIASDAALEVFLFFVGRSTL